MIVILEFTPWKKWIDRSSFQNMKYPGIYAIAMSDNDLTDKRFELIPNIVYFGMTNSKDGIKSRLDQFNNSIQTPQRSPGHGGADRMKYKHQDYEKTVSHLFVSIFPVICEASANNPTYLRAKGKVAGLEYECFAQYCDKFSNLPEFNDSKRSPKKYSSRK